MKKSKNIPKISQSYRCTLELLQIEVAKFSLMATKILKTLFGFISQ